MNRVFEAFIFWIIVQIIVSGISYFVGREPNFDFAAGAILGATVHTFNLRKQLK